MADNEDIKQAAFRLFAAQGYKCTSMKDIAQAVGLKKQSLYSHFTCKQELYEVVLHEQIRYIMSELHIAVERLENEPVDVLLKGVFQCLVDIFSCKERLLLWKRAFMMHGEMGESASKASHDWHFDGKLKDRLFNIISAKINKLGNPENFHSFFITYMLSIQGYFDWMVMKGHNEDVFNIFWNNIWSGINHFID